MYLAIGLIFILGSSLMLHMVLFAEAFAWVPKHTKDTLFISAVCTYVLYKMICEKLYYINK